MYYTPLTQDGPSCCQRVEPTDVQLTALHCSAEADLPTWLQSGAVRLTNRSTALTRPQAPLRPTTATHCCAGLPKTLRMTASTRPHKSTHQIPTQPTQHRPQPPAVDAPQRQLSRRRPVFVAVLWSCACGLHCTSGLRPPPRTGPPWDTPCSKLLSKQAQGTPTLVDQTAQTHEQKTHCCTPQTIPRPTTAHNCVMHSASDVQLEARATHQRQRRASYGL